MPSTPTKPSVTDLSPYSPSQVCSAAEFWRKHKEEERRVEEERLQQEKELIMKEARQFLEQKRSAEERKALAMKRWESGEDESQKCSVLL